MKKFLLLSLILLTTTAFADRPVLGVGMNFGTGTI